MVLALLEKDYEEIRQMNRTIRDLSSENRNLSSENKDLKTVQRDYARMLLSQDRSVAEVAAKTHLTPEEVEML